MKDLSAYSSSRLMTANQSQLKKILVQFKQEHLPLWKVGLFVGYNAISLIGMYFYGIKLRGKRVAPSLGDRNRFSIAQLFRKGVTHSLFMMGVYMGGLYLVCRETLSLQLLRKLTQIQATYHSFGLRFDPNYQDHLLFSRMRKFDLPEILITEIKQELEAQKENLIQSGGLLPQTQIKIKEAEAQFIDRAKQLR